jgi:phosphatidylserine decarboxylase
VRRLPIAPEAWIILLPLLVVAAAALLIQWYAAALLFLTLAAVVAQIFRDPRRAGSGRHVDVLAAADGTVVHAGAITGNPPPGEFAQQISIISSLFDVHVLRAPIGGKVTAVEEKKEPRYAVIEASSGAFAVVHHAGILSRAQLETRKGEQLARGERIGMTRFGSQVDIFLPAAARLSVRVQERVKVGLTVIAEVE